MFVRKFSQAFANKKKITLFFLSLTGFAMGLTKEIHASNSTIDNSSEDGLLRDYSLEEIGQHDTLESGLRSFPSESLQCFSSLGVWVTYRGFVYDVTGFLRSHQHPGGNDYLMLAAGGAIDDYVCEVVILVLRLIHCSGVIGLLTTGMAKYVICVVTYSLVYS
jgi:hypothetical protein